MNEGNCRSYFFAIIYLCENKIVSYFLGAHEIPVVVHGNHIRLAQQEDTSNQFAVNESGREHVLREKQKNIHAFVIGEFEGIGEIDRPD